MHSSVSPTDSMIFPLGRMALCVDGYEKGWSQEVTECLKLIILLCMFCGMIVSLLVLRFNLCIANTMETYSLCSAYYN